jgi:hypothetical protein
MAMGISPNEEIDNVWKNTCTALSEPSGVRKRFDKDMVMVVAKNTATTEPAAISHFSCRRATPLARRYLRTLDTAAANTASGISGRATANMTFNTGWSASTASGLSCNGIATSSTGPGNSAMPRNAETPTARVPHARMRQRGEGRWPSGNSRIR